MRLFSYHNEGMVWRLLASLPWTTLWHSYYTKLFAGKTNVLALLLRLDIEAETTKYNIAHKK